MPEPKRRSRSLTLMVIAGIVLILGYLIVGSQSLIQAECSLCVEFQGQVQCRTGTGADEGEAQQAAQKAACAVMAGGMNESIACNNAPVTRVQCGG